MPSVMPEPAIDKLSAPTDDPLYAHTDRPELIPDHVRERGAFGLASAGNPPHSGQRRADAGRADSSTRPSLHAMSNGLGLVFAALGAIAVLALLVKVLASVFGGN